MHRQSQAQRGFLHWRRIASCPPRPFGRSGCVNTAEDAMAGLDHAFERRNRERGRAEKNQVHSPAFTNLRTLRRIRSRFSALTWLMYRLPFR